MNIEIIPVTSFQQNCSLVWDEEKNAAIIDPGGEAEKLIKRIEELGLTLKVILLTHGHLDHVGAAPKLKQHFEVAIVGPHSLDAEWFAHLPEQSRQFGLFEIPAFEPDRWLDQEGEIIEVGDMQFEVRYLPGHSAGHIGFIEHKKRISFTGDVLFKQSIGRTDLAGGNYQQLLQTIREKVYPLGDDMIIVAGHGPYTTVGQEKLHNPFVKEA